MKMDADDMRGIVYDDHTIVGVEAELLKREGSGGVGRRRGTKGCGGWSEGVAEIKAMFRGMSRRAGSRRRWCVMGGRVGSTHMSTGS